MAVLDPQALDQLRCVAARFRELLAHSLAERRRERVHLPDRWLAALLHRDYRSSGRRAGLCRNRDTSAVGRLRTGYEAVARRRWAIITIQLVALALVLF